ncbi:hypothetical protein V6N12_047991 [Hibiscus sabdariffa]|uniref:Pentatricopeptide repeat-containing protein n=1 Tax=Hibiscus sabdariffa TaxID=183260 RepID=A0ABR2CUK6_9ROSI
MGKLIPSLLNLSIPQSAFSPGLKTTITHVQAFTKNFNCFHNVDQALALFKEMISQIGCGFLVLGKMMKLCVEPNVVTFSTLINGLSYTAIIDCLCKKLYLKDALSLFSKLKEKTIRPNTITYNCLIKASLGLDQQQVAKRLLDEMEDNKILLDVVTYSILVDWLCKKERLDEAKKIMDTIRKRGIEPGIVIYNNLLAVYCKKDLVSDVQDIIDMVRMHVIEPDAFTYGILVDFFCKKKLFKEAKDIVDTMGKRGI